MFRNLTTPQIARGAVVAALYFALTVALPFASYGDIQFRFSEILVLLCFYNPAYAPAMILGCAIANIFSPLGYIDVLFGSAATALAVIPMCKMKNIWLAALLPVVTNGIIVGLMLSIFYELPFIITCLSVAAGQFAVIVVAGVPLFRYLLEKNKPFMRVICAHKAENL